VNDELYTGDLDISSVQTRSQLAAFLRTVHLRADRPSLRTLEMRTRHESTPLSKTVVSEMLKGTRFPRKAVMVSFLRTCGVSEDMMESWRRAWERVAASESAVYRPTAGQDQPPSGGAHANWPAAPDHTNGPEILVARTGRPRGVMAALPEPRAKQPQDPASPSTRGRAVPGPLIRRRELGTLLRRSLFKI
jgi:hypothetical protein